jgi:hypothetical protein
MTSTAQHALESGLAGDSLVAEGELVYEYTLRFTSVTEYGATLGDLLAGKEALPPAGARIDVAFEGTCTGPRLKGSVKGVDYLNIRADGRVDLHIHADITTDEGARIALEAGGVAMLTPGSPIGQLRENVALATSHPDYLWVNPIQVWATGAVHLDTGEVRVKAYAA